MTPNLKIRITYKKEKRMQVNYELITGLALGIENFLDEEDEMDAWIISLLIFRIIILR